MKIYGYYRSSASYRLRIALNLKRLEVEAIAVHIRRGEQHLPDYLTLNPLGLVPAIEDNGRVLTQSLAIIEYLDETYPQPAFLPRDPFARAQVRALAQIIACDVHPLNNLRVLNYLRDAAGMDEPARQAWYAHWVALGLSAVEALLAADGDVGDFCHGGSPGLADICLVPQAYNAERFGCSLDPYPIIRRIVANARALDAFIQAEPGRQADAE